MDHRNTPAYRLELALLQTIARFLQTEPLTDPEIELATGNLFCTMICTLGMKNRHSRETMLRHARDVGRLLPANVRTKLDHVGPPPFPEHN
jgi:hypothetical protein